MNLIQLKCLDTRTAFSLIQKAIITFKSYMF